MTAPVPQSTSFHPDAPVFDDGKAPDALRTIGEVTRALGIRQHVLRYWEEQFPALRPIKRSGNRRYYRPEDVALIARINRLVHYEGYTIKGAAKALGSLLTPQSVTTRSETPAAEAGPAALPQVPASLLDGLRQVRADLARALAQA